MDEKQAKLISMDTVDLEQVLEVLTQVNEDMPVFIEDENRNIKPLKGINVEDDGENYRVILSVYNIYE
ncbi:hypothetical protein NST17_20355 [Caldifermentibacillus hisashii]|uniref:Uncharacterized protein n=1 Tax=Caldifermentibacillus hisashii TaxID=996558 RepID=A0ABU9K4W3_9BACI